MSQTLGALLLALLLTGCDNISPHQLGKIQSTNNEPVYRLSPQAIVIQGTIDDAMAKRFQEMLTTGDVLVHLRSPGGTVKAGITIGREIHRRNLDVVVDGRCASACANYLFAAGRQKRVVDKGVLLMHGASTFRPAVTFEQFPKITSRQVAVRALSHLSLQPFEGDARYDVEYERIRAILNGPLKEANLRGYQLETSYYAELGIAHTLLDFSTVVGLCNAAESVEIKINLPGPTDSLNTSYVPIDIKSSYTFGRYQLWLSPTREDLESVGIKGIVEFRDPEAITASLREEKTKSNDKIIFGPISNLREKDCAFIDGK